MTGLNVPMQLWVILNRTFESNIDVPGKVTLGLVFSGIHSTRALVFLVIKLAKQVPDYHRKTTECSISTSGLQYSSLFHLCYTRLKKNSKIKCLLQMDVKKQNMHLAAEVLYM